MNIFEKDPFPFQMPFGTITFQIWQQLMAVTAILKNYRKSVQEIISCNCMKNQETATAMEFWISFERPLNML